ncbi:MAG: TonB system transport protein ExbD [Thioalkalispiraceae bacterium]|jgi:biopolymer transport protein ExbD
MKPIAVMNVIPFIDIMLVLLAIVLTTSTFLAQGKIPLRLPEAGSAETLSTIKSVEINIDARGKIYLDQQAVQLDSLASQFTGLSAETAVVLRVDKEADFQYFVAVIDLLKAHNLTNISIITKKAGG